MNKKVRKINKFKLISRNYYDNDLNTRSLKLYSKTKINSMSTDPDSNVGFHSPSPKKSKKFSFFKMVEKSKNTKKFLIKKIFFLKKKDFLEK